MLDRDDVEVDEDDDDGGGHRPWMGKSRPDHSIAHLIP